MERGGAGWSGTSKPSHESSTTVLSTLELDRTHLSIVRDRGAAGGSDSEQKVAMIQTGLVAQFVKRRAWYPKVLVLIPTFSTKHVTCLSPAVGGLK